MSLYLLKDNNLGDVEDIERARENLGISRDIIDPNNIDIKGGSISVENFRLNQSEPFDKGYILTTDSNGNARWSVLELSNLHEVTNISSFINNVPYASEEWTSSNFMRNQDNLSGITDRIAALSNLGLTYTFGDSDNPSDGYQQVFNIEMSNLRVMNNVEMNEVTINDKLFFNNDFVSTNNVLCIDPSTKELVTFELGNDINDITSDIIDDSTKRPPSMALLNTVYQNISQSVANVEFTLSNIVIDNYYLKITKNLEDIPNPEVARENLGFGQITISNNSIQTGSLYLNDEFRLTRSTPAIEDGQFLMCDATGKGTWHNLPVANVVQPGIVRFTTDYNYNTANDDSVLINLKAIKDYNDSFSTSTQSKIDLCLKTANLFSEFKDLNTANRTALLSNLHITESDIFEFPKNLGFFQDDVGYLRADNFLSELNYNREQTRSNLQLNTVAWTGSYYDLLDQPYLDDFSNVFLQKHNNLSELAYSEANRTAARENLGLSDMSTMSRSNVDIHGGLITDLTSIKTTELILEDTVNMPETVSNTCFLKAYDSTGIAKWALLPEASSTQKGITILQNVFDNIDNQYDNNSTYTSSVIREKINSVASEIDRVIIDTTTIDANIESNQQSIESLSTALSIAVYRPVSGLNATVDTLTTKLGSLETLVDDNHNQFDSNNVRIQGEFESLKLTTEHNLEIVRLGLQYQINDVNAPVNSNISLLTQLINFEVLTLNGKIDDVYSDIDIDNRINTEIVSLSNLVETEGRRIDTLIGTEVDKLNLIINHVNSNLEGDIKVATDILNGNISSVTNTLNGNISSATTLLDTRITSETSNLDLKIEYIESDIHEIKYSSNDTSLRSLHDELQEHIQAYEDFYITVGGVDSTDSNYMRYKVNRLWEDVKHYGGIMDQLGDLNTFSNVTSDNLQDALNRVLILETNYGHTSDNIIQIDQEIENTNDFVTSNLGRIIALETHQGYTNTYINDLRDLISDNDSNITINLELINSMNTDLQVHKTDYEHLEEDVNSNIHKITALQDSLWGISDQNTFGVKGHLSNLQDDFDTHVTYITGQITTLSGLIGSIDSNLEQTDKDLSSLSNVFENHLIHYGYLEKDVDSNINRITNLEHSLWGTNSETPTGIRGDLTYYMTTLNQHLTDYNNLQDFSESNIHDLNVRVSVLEGGSSNQLDNLHLRVTELIPQQLTQLNDKLLLVEGINNNTVGLVDSLNSNVDGLSNLVTDFGESIETLSNAIANNNNGIQQIQQDTNLLMDKQDSNIYHVRRIESSLFNNESSLSDNSLILNSLSNVIYEPTGLSESLQSIISDYTTFSNNISPVASEAYNIADSLSTDIYITPGGLSVTLSNCLSDVTLHNSDISSIQANISTINDKLGIDGGGGSGTSQYLTNSLWETWKDDTFQPVSDAVTRHALSITAIEGDIPRIDGQIIIINSSLSDKAEKSEVSSITDVYMIPPPGATDVRLSIGLGILYIQKHDVVGGGWINKHIFR